jgi:hypothetical protein
MRVLTSVLTQILAGIVRLRHDVFLLRLKLAMLRLCIGNPMRRQDGQILR